VKAELEVHRIDGATVKAEVREAVEGEGVNEEGEG
jgi:hypothetical protein